MRLNQLQLIQFKNYADLELSFAPKLNAFVGKNGVGKTNILDAMYYLSFTKSYFGNPDTLAVKYENDFFMIQGEYLRDIKTEKIYCAYKKGQKKQLKRNDKAYSKFLEHIGLFPAVMITPNDISLITGSSEDRRKFLDSIISQYDPKYLLALLKYNKILTERNKTLKLAAKNNQWDQTLIDVLNEQLVSAGKYIHQQRKQFTDDYLAVFKQYHQHISEHKDDINLVYQSKLNQHNFTDLLNRNQEKDRILQHTSVGIHRDDLEFMLGAHPIKKIGSQGQQKTYLVAIKFAQYELIKQHLKINPILLLDDVFDKLDSRRVHQIVELVSQDTFGQIFFTDTSSERIANIFEKMNTSYTIFKLSEDQKIEIDEKK